MRRLVPTVGIVALVALLLAWGAFDILRDRQETEAGAYRNAANLTDAITSQTEQILTTAENGLAALEAAIPRRDIGDPAWNEAIFDQLSDRQKASHAVHAFLILDRDGRLVHSSRGRQPRPVDFSAAPWFARASARPGTAAAIGRPVLLQIEEGQRAWVIPMSRPVLDATGRAAAFFVAAVSIDQMAQLYTTLDLGRAGRATLFRKDGIVLTTHPFRVEALGNSRGRLPLFEEHLSRAPAGRFVADHPIDGVRRMVTYRSLSGYPAVVAIGLEEAWVLAPWRTRSLRTMISLGVLALLVALLVFYVRRIGLQRVAAAAEQTRRLNLLAGASIGLARTRSAETMLGSAASLARQLVRAHQAVVTETPADGAGAIIHAVSLSDRYAEWRGYHEEPTGAGIYRLIAETNRPMRMTQAELEAHPAWRGFGDAAHRHPPMRGWLAVPLVGQDGRNIGIIQLSDREEGEFDEADEAICQQLALMVSALIENLRADAALAAALAAEREARSEAELLRSRNAAILDSISDAFYVLDRDFRFRYLNARATATLGRGELVGRNVWDAFPEAVDTVLKPSYEAALAGGQAVAFTFYFAPLHAWFDVRAYPFEDGLSVYFRDVTEKMETEAKLVQAQKMEAVGQLTGGIAHDFNNLLTVILGMGDAILGDPADPAAVREKVSSIVAAGERAAQLTSSLLAFSRRHPMDPRPTDISQLIARSEGLLSRALGEGIEIEVVTSGSLWRAMVDAAQLELAILNLAINGRDAMPEAGRLTIEAANARLDEAYARANAEVVAGQYVMVAVSDTGTGMPAEVAERAFEPFFTTKAVGKGSGLGLSMVYGFVKQSGGHVKIYTEPGEGTSVKLYLPRAVERLAPITGPGIGNEAVDLPPGGDETILVVEDDAEIRRLIASSLQALGYGVTAVASGVEALERFAAARFDLLLTDVMLPHGMNGRQLADEAGRRQPGLAVLYTSGYTENAIVHHGRLDPGVRLLRKPFRHADLAHMVRIALADVRGETR